MQIKFVDAENQTRWAVTDGLRTLEQREIAVTIPWLEQDPRERLLTDLLKFIESYLSDQSTQILAGQTMHYGWTTLRFVQDEHNLSGAGPEVLLIEEIEHPFAPDDTYVSGVAHTMALMQLQEEAMRRNTITGDALYPHRSRFALICKRVTPKTVQFLRPLVAHRAWQPRKPDSGWFIGCCSNDHDHDDPEELARIHLIHLAEHFPAIFPYVAMPVDTKLIFEETQVILFRPGEQEGYVDTGSILSFIP